jgi:hypothetical protein
MGIPRIHRLQVIHLYECNLSLLFLLFFRELDQHCEDNYLINKGVYGCRPNRGAIDPVFVDVTQTEMAMVTRTPLVKFNNDATACFDRILVHTLNLCLRSFRMPKKLTGGFQRNLYPLFTKCNEMDRRWKIIIFLTHLFNARKGNLSSKVPFVCGIGC